MMASYRFLDRLMIIFLSVVSCLSSLIKRSDNDGQICDRKMFGYDFKRERLSRTSWIIIDAFRIISYRFLFYLVFVRCLVSLSNFVCRWTSLGGYRRQFDWRIFGDFCTLSANVWCIWITHRNSGCGLEKSCTSSAMMLKGFAICWMKSIAKSGSTKLPENITWYSRNTSTSLHIQLFEDCPSQKEGR